MGFWDKLKRGFGGRGGGDDTAPGATQPAAGAAPSTGTERDPAPRRTAAEDLARYRADEILGLSMAEVRKRSLKIDPYRTPWIGRVDTIPPQTDERTAL